MAELKALQYSRISKRADQYSVETNPAYGRSSG